MCLGALPLLLKVWTGLLHFGPADLFISWGTLRWKQVGNMTLHLAPDSTVRHGSRPVLAALMPCLPLFKTAPHTGSFHEPAYWADDGRCRRRLVWHVRCEWAIQTCRRRTQHQSSGTVLPAKAYVTGWQTALGSCQGWRCRLAIRSEWLGLLAVVAPKLRNPFRSGPSGQAARGDATLWCSATLHNRIISLICAVFDLRPSGARCWRQDAPVARKVLQYFP